MNVKDKAKSFVENNCEKLLTGGSAIGTIGTGILAVVATNNAKKEIAKREEEFKRKLTKKEIVKYTWKFFIPVVVSTGLSIACAVLSNKKSSKKINNLAAAYNVASTMASTYKDNLVDVIGEEKTKEIEKNAVSEISNTKNEEKVSGIVVNHDDDILVYDPKFGRYFTTTIQKIDNSINAINYKMLCENEASVNDLYYELGVEGVEAGDDFIWKVENGMIQRRGTARINDENKLYYELGFSIKPKKNNKRY